MIGPVIEAVVQVGDVETCYLRCGRGTRVMLAVAATDAERRWIMSRFGADYRVIAPVPPDVTHATDTLRLEQWLRGVMEGLGLERPVITLASSLTAEADWLGAAFGESVDVVLTLGQAEVDPGRIA